MGDALPPRVGPLGAGAVGRIDRGFRQELPGFVIASTDHCLRYIPHPVVAFIGGDELQLWAVGCRGRHTFARQHPTVVYELDEQHKGELPAHLDVNGAAAGRPTRLPSAQNYSSGYARRGCVRGARSRRGLNGWLVRGTRRDKAKKKQHQRTQQRRSPNTTGCHDALTLVGRC